MAASGLPFFFEDTKGSVSGPTDFLDIYDRPPFLRLVPNHCAVHSRSHASSRANESQTLNIFELGARTFMSPRRQLGTVPSAVIVFNGDSGGSIRFRSGMTMQIERWLYKSMRFGSTLMRQFKGSDGMHYQWSLRSMPEHEWACIQLGSNYLVAHYDLKPSAEPRHKTSGNVFTVYENWVYLSVELLASLIIMRHIHASISSHR